MISRKYLKHKKQGHQLRSVENLVNFLEVKWFCSVLVIFVKNKCLRVISSQNLDHKLRLVENITFTYFKTWSECLDFFETGSLRRKIET